MQNPFLSIPASKDNKEGHFSTNLEVEQRVISDLCIQFGFAIGVVHKWRHEYIGTKKIVKLKSLY